MSTVYITNLNPDHDYSGAEKHGVLRPLTSGNYSIFKTSRLIEEIVGGLVDSTEEDFLLISGSSVVASLCMAIWLMQHKSVQMLLHDRRNTEYVIRIIQRDSLKLKIEQTHDQAVRRQEEGK